MRLISLYRSHCFSLFLGIGTNLDCNQFQGILSAILFRLRPAILEIPQDVHPVLKLSHSSKYTTVCETRLRFA